jgi:hypothetical protein
MTLATAFPSPDRRRIEANRDAELAQTLFDLRLLDLAGAFVATVFLIRCRSSVFVDDELADDPFENG